MNKEFIPYEQALELKELGFNENCFASYTYDRSNEGVMAFDIKEQNGLRWSTNTNEQRKQYKEPCTAPTFSQAFRWFREKYGLYADLFVDDDQTFGFCVSSFAEEGRCRLDKPIKRQFSTYEESELECIKFLIEIVDRKAEANS